MTSNEIGIFIANIIETLHKNGYPDKKVSLPLEKMYEKAHEKGLNFNKVLEFLEEKGIANSKTPEKVIFFPKVESGVKSETPPQGSVFGEMLKNFDPSVLAGMDRSGIMSQVEQMWKNMSPEQMDQMRKMVADLSPAERDELMKVAKKTGLT